MQWLLMALALVAGGLAPLRVLTAPDLAGARTLLAPGALGQASKASPNPGRNPLGKQHGSLATQGPNQESLGAHKKAPKREGGGAPPDDPTLGLLAWGPYFQAYAGSHSGALSGHATPTVNPPQGLSPEQGGQTGPPEA